MNKSNKTERTATVTTAPAAQSKRYDATFKREAVENWIKSSKPGTQIAAELGISYQTSPTAKRGVPRRQRAFGNHPAVSAARASSAVPVFSRK